MMRVLAFVCAAAVLLLSAQAASAESLGSIRVTSRNNGICDANVKQQSGYYDLTTGDAHYFYWMFESRNNPSTDPFIIWMTGGPGCSGMMALTNENGPCTVNEDGVDTSNNPYSWTNNATVLWIDQPTGTGFSYGKQKVSDEAGVAANFYDFVSQFMLANPQYAKLPFYVVGESYGGHYVPAVSEYINAQNQKIIENGLDAQIINLAGIAVGNGMNKSVCVYYAYEYVCVCERENQFV
jgi:cathepsin A (carboxypeptidase C)